MKLFYPHTPFGQSRTSLGEAFPEVVTWMFNPLRLVDSFTNESGSHGFVMLTVNMKSNMTIGSTVSNKAHIYFDYNDPIVTNTVADNISEPNSTSEVRSSDGITVKAFPNPFRNTARIAILIGILHHWYSIFKEQPHSSRFFIFKISFRGSQNYLLLSS